MRTKDTEKHQNTKTCLKGQRRRKNKNLQDTQHKAGKKLCVCGKKLEQASEFKYSGRILTDDNNNDKAIDNQLVRARQ